MSSHAAPRQAVEQRGLRGPEPDGEGLAQARCLRTGSPLASMPTSLFVAKPASRNLCPCPSWPTALLVQRNQQRRLEQPLRWDRWSATRRVHFVEGWRQLTQGSIRKLLDDPQRVVPRDPLLHVHERQHRCLRITSAPHSGHPRRRWLYRIRLTHPTGRANLGRSRFGGAALVRGVGKAYPDRSGSTPEIGLAPG
jgi:hypothetical protein